MRPVGLNLRVETPVVKKREPDRGSYAPGAQSPEAEGCAISVSVQTGVNMQPRVNPFTGSAHWGAVGSPAGIGCVAAVFCRGSCGTGFSSTPVNGLPLVRSRI